MSKHVGVAHERGRRDVVGAVLGVLSELLLTLAVVVGGYILWQLWWTGVEAEEAQADQRSQVSWVQPGKDADGYAIAQPQQGDPPVQPADPEYGDLIAQLYVPRFGQTWQRNVVEGTDAYQLSRHGLGHYESSQEPGELGNVAIAGHRSGYGEPLAHVDELQPGDKIILRTKDYWYVYTYTGYDIVTPDRTDVLAAVPKDPDATPTERYITLTTCEPRYTTATHRWISYGTFDYWAKVSDGIPQELATTDSSGAVSFTQNGSASPWARMSSSLDRLVYLLAVIYVVVYLAALVAWRYPMLRDIRYGRRRRPGVSVYGWLYRHQPGPAPIRVVLMAVAVLAVIGALFEWGYPWAASTIPYLQVASNYVAVG